MHGMERLPICALYMLLASISTVSAASTFRFANYYGDHMVLQRAPHSANVWGLVTECDGVTIEFNGKMYTATMIQDGPGMCKWRVTLPPTTDIGPYVITAKSQKYGSISLSDVLFGDVWICSGQSNMQFTVPQAFNASEEIAKAANYPHIRLFTAALKASKTPVDELLGVEQQWAVAGPTTVNGSAWSYFSATCWFFGRDTYDYVKHPIGLVDTDWGGTPVEAWSSPDALAKCFKQSRDKLLPKAPNPNEHSVLWNAMIYPFLNMTIYGAIWYQGEANAGAPSTYNCTFPAMIDDWRAKWYQHSGSLTDPLFPFGFVQLSATGNSNVTVGGFPVIRWAQTDDYGYVPNKRMEKVFMAVAMDLGDPTSPFGSIHPRDKEDVGARLALAGRAVAYGDTGVYFTGPLAKSAKLTPTTVESITRVEVSYDNISPSSGLDLRYPYGFELGCASADGTITQWIEGSAVKAMGSSIMVEVDSCSTGNKAAMIRYCWRTDPCTFKKCPVYSDELPSPPFIMPLV